MFEDPRKSPTNYSLREPSTLVLPKVGFTECEPSKTGGLWHKYSDGGTQVGYLAKPKQPTSPQNGKAIVYVGGSEGGVDHSLTDYFADKGFVSFAIGYHQGNPNESYFRAPEELHQGLPRDLANINLDRLGAAIQWFRKNQPNKDEKVILCGWSRGGELALILASLFREHFSKVVTLLPSSRVIGAYSWDEWLCEEYCSGEVPAWVLGDGKAYSGEGERLIGSIWGRIPLEKITAQIMAVSGTNDKIWGGFSSSIKDPALKQGIEECFHAETLLRDRNREGDSSLTLEGVGHLCYPARFIEGLYSTEVLEKMRDAWERIFYFLKIEPPSTRRFLISSPHSARRSPIHLAERKRPPALHS